MRTVSMRWFLCSLLLFKIIFSMKRDYGNYDFFIQIITFSVKRYYDSIFLDLWVCFF